MQIGTDATKGNPFVCDCSLSPLWPWLSDHIQLLENQQAMTCSSPDDRRGSNFLDEALIRRCSQSLIHKLAIQDIQPNSLMVTWQSNNTVDVKGFKVVYHALDYDSSVSTFSLGPDVRSYQMLNLTSDTSYFICVDVQLAGPLAATSDTRLNLWSRPHVIEEAGGTRTVGTDLQPPFRKCSKTRTLTSSRRTSSSSIISNFGLVVALSVGIGLLCLVVLCALILMKRKKAQSISSNGSIGMRSPPITPMKNGGGSYKSPPAPTAAIRNGGVSFKLDSHSNGNGGFRSGSPSPEDDFLMGHRHYDFSNHDT
ncbi:unnamed protein product [Cyprideis torosa]|uniref:Uncharacterized protein n=1 Tax=Cyprideis torosa TaxID=163714 RepID=A0A7R8WKC1_9CRUS|nr:unnamed protein product [Cyprideis torosa]CAG0896748.1 unnamed protein product [Cyprideis torosa]